MKKILIMGGSFDPPHLGHTAIAAGIQATLGIDEVVFLPCGTHAMKAGFTTSNEDRINMLTLAIADFPGFTIDLHEISKPNTSYTVESLHYFKEKYPDAALHFPIGQDILPELTRWKDWQTLTQLATLIIVDRPGPSLSLDPNLDAWIQAQTQLERIRFYAPDTPLPYASTDIRYRVAHNEDISSMVTATVLNHIKEHRLYTR